MALNFNNPNLVPTNDPSTLDYFVSSDTRLMYINQVTGDVFLSKPFYVGSRWVYQSSFAQTWNSGTLIWSQPNNAFIFLKYDSGESLISTDNGVTWTTYSVFTPPMLIAFIFGSNIFIANGISIFRSSDGISFTNIGPLPSTPNSINGSAFNQNIVLVGYPGWIVYSDDGGSTWFASTGHDTGETINYNSVAYGNGKFLVVGADNYGSNRTYQSTDGVAWTAISMPPTPTTIAFGNQTFLLNCQGTLYTGSGDGSWTLCNTSVEDQFNKIFYDPHDSLFLVPTNADTPLISDTIFKYNEPYEISAFDGPDFVLAPAFQPHASTHKLNMNYANAIVLGTFTSDTTFSFINPPNVDGVEGYPDASFSLLPLELVVLNVTTTQVDFSWIPFTTDTYTILLDGSIIDYGIKGNTYTISNLIPATSHTLQVHDITSNIYSQLETVQTTRVPTPVVTLSSVTTNRVDFTWDPYTTDIYSVILNGYTVQSGLTGNTSSISYLTPLTVYTLQVIDTTYNVASNVTTFTTQALAPPFRLVTSTTNGQFIIPSDYLPPPTLYTRMFAVENIRIVYKTSANPIESFVVHIGELNTDVITFPYQSAITNYSATIHSNTIGTPIPPGYGAPNISVYLQSVSSIDGQRHEVNDTYQCTASFILYNYQA